MAHVTEDEIDIGNISLIIKPKPVYTVFKLSREELDRLGDGYTYNVQSWMKLNNENIRGYDVRIGVFNNIILENLLYYKLEYSVTGNTSSIDFEYSTDEFKYIVTPSHDIVIDGVVYTAGETFELNMVDLEEDSLTFSCDNDLLDLYIEIINTESRTLVEKQLHVVEFNSEIDSDILETICDETDYPSLSVDEIFQNAKAWSDPLTVSNAYSNVSCEFKYDEDYPVYIIIQHGFVDPDVSLNFTIPTIKEAISVTTTDQVIFPVPILGVISDSVNASELTLKPYENSNSIICYGFDVGDIETNDNMSVLGVQVNLDIDMADDLIIFATLRNDAGVQCVRSVLIDKSALSLQDNKVSLGGTYDLWGFTIDDMVNLDAWSLELQFNNPFTNESANIVLNDVEIVFFTNVLEDQLIKCTINGIDTRHYGMFIESADVPTALKTNVKYLDIDGTDINTAYRQNIDKKDITIKFYILGCTLEETTSLLKMIGKLFTNERDELNKPIPNQLELSNYPNEYWNVILEDPIDSDVEDVAYSSTLKLVVPDGTSYSVNDIVTSTVGVCNSIAKVNPIITIVITNPTAESFEINELESEQSMVIQYKGFISNDVLQLDCSNQKLILNTYSESLQRVVEVDISYAVDWSSDWFSLFGKYQFESKNCMIQTIRFNERG